MFKDMFPKLEKFIEFKITKNYIVNGNFIGDTKIRAKAKNKRRQIYTKQGP